MSVADLGSAGAFIDTTGERKKTRKNRVLVEPRGDKEEEELEALVFGGLKSARVFSEEYDSGECSSEEVRTSLACLVTFVTDRVAALRQPLLL